MSLQPRAKSSSPCCSLATVASTVPLHKTPRRQRVFGASRPKSDSAQPIPVVPMDISAKTRDANQADEQRV
jgi:hypothetical protein